MTTRVKDPDAVDWAPEFQVGMRLEAVNPTRVNSICVASIKRILRKGYIMIGIDGPHDPHPDSYYCERSQHSLTFP